MLFLDRNTIYRIIQRELPGPDVYPDGAPDAFFSTSDSMSTAIVLEGVYNAASGTYNEMFPGSSVDRIDDWCQAVFGQKFDATVTLIEKQQRVLTKLQKIPSLSTWALLTLALSYVPAGTFVRLFHFCGPNGNHGNWILGQSQLGYDTYLASLAPAQIGIPANVLDDMANEWCPFISNLHWRLGVDELGVETFLAYLKYIDIANFQQDAYLYQVLIFNKGQPQLSAETIASMDADLSANEPGRSGHRIVQNLDINTSGLNTIDFNVGQFSGVDCAAVDPVNSPQTGYTGRSL